MGNEMIEPDTLTATCEPTRSDEKHTFSREALIDALCNAAGGEPQREWAEEVADRAFARVAAGSAAFFPGNCPGCSAGDAERAQAEQVRINEALSAANTPEGKARQRAENDRINAANAAWEAQDEFCAARRP